MMWWVNKFGRVTGPYSDEQIQSGIRQNQFTRLNKISNDQQTWMRLDQTKFWQPVSPAPESAAAANPFETGAAPGKLRRPSATPTPGPTPFRRPAPAPEPEESMPPPRQTPPLSSRFDLNQKASGGDGGGKNRKWLWIGGGIAACFAAALVAVVLVIGVLAYRGRSGEPSFDDVKKCIVLAHESGGRSMGTGFLVKMDGKKYVMTNDHVARSSDTPKMVLIDGTELKLGAFSTASDRDLARFEVLDYSGDCLEFSENIPNVGDKIWVYGNSMGDDVITALKGSVTGVGNKFIKIDAEVVGGNSGSPTLDKDGKVIAVHSYALPGENGQNWKTKGTQFDEVRRFCIRLTNVKWESISRDEYEKECATLEFVNRFTELVRAYFSTEEKHKAAREELALLFKGVEQRDVAGDKFGEELMALSKSFEVFCGELGKMQELGDPEAFNSKLMEAVNEETLSYENAKKMRESFNAKYKAANDAVTQSLYGFYAKRKEALVFAKGFLMTTDWKSSLIKHGRGDELTWYKMDSVDYLLSQIEALLSRNALETKALD